MPSDEGSSVWNPDNQIFKQGRYLDKIDPDSIPTHGHHDDLQNRAKMKPSCL